MEAVAIMAAADALLPARNQMALSLGWHIIYACFGMALPAMIFVFHRRGLKGDADALELAKRWSKVGAVLFAVGAVSGTILSFELGLLWPGLMERFGDVVGLAFALEGISFFTEAIFLGIYVYGWGRLPGRLHSLMLLPTMVAGIVGSFMVVSVNAWMNAPSGFTLVGEGADAEVIDVDPVAAILNDHVWLQFLHMYLAAVMVVGFTMAGVYAFGMLRGRVERLHRLGAIVPLCFVAVAAPIQPVVGHFAGQRIADDQPIKLAAIEVLETTEARAPLVVGGIVIDGELRGGVEIPIPGLLSFLAQNDFDATVVGLDAVPADERPPVAIVHLAYTVMVGIGTALVGLVVWGAWRYRRAEAPDSWAGFFGSTRFLRSLVVAGPAAIVAMETGWITTEVGRQPWIVHGILRTEDAVTDAGYIWLTLTVLVVVYTALTFGTLWTLLSMSRRWTAGETDLATPYGPPMDVETEAAGTREAAR